MACTPCREGGARTPSTISNNSFRENAKVPDTCLGEQDHWVGFVSAIQQKPMMGKLVASSGVGFDAQSCLSMGIPQVQSNPRRTRAGPSLRVSEAIRGCR